MPAITNWLLYLSSYLPLWIIIYISQIHKFNMHAIVKPYTHHIYIWTFVIILNILSLSMLMIFLTMIHHDLKTTDKRNIIYKQVSQININLLIPYLIIYSLCLQNDQLSKYVIIILSIILWGLVVQDNQLWAFNIILLLCGYHIYTFNQDFYLITRKSISEIKWNELEPHQFGTTNIVFK